MRRRLFTILSLFSLVLLVAVCALWVRSHWRADVIDWDADTSGKLIVVASYRGRLVWHRYDQTMAQLCTGGWGYRSRPCDAHDAAVMDYVYIYPKGYGSASLDWSWSWARFRVRLTDNWHNGRSVLAMPHAMLGGLLLVGAVMPVVLGSPWAVANRDRHRRLALNYASAFGPLVVIIVVGTMLIRSVRSPSHEPVGTEL